jgi:hypothetical protein
MARSVSWNVRCSRNKCDSVTDETPVQGLQYDEVHLLGKILIRGMSE